MNNLTRTISLVSSALILILLLSGCLKEEDRLREYTGFTPITTTDNWEISSPQTEGMDSAALDQIYRDLYVHPKAWSLYSMLVIRNGKLVAESYLQDPGELTKQRAIWSCTKQVTGIITGIAIEEGLIGSVNDPVSKYLDTQVKTHPDKGAITLADLLTMRSGITFSNDKNTNALRNRSVESSVDYIFGLDLSWQPGTHYQYNDGAPQIVSAIISEATGKSMARYAEEKFFSKIGLTQYEWKEYPDGITFGAFGLMMPPRELARIGQCVCNGGKWGNEQVIPADWLREMLTIRVPDLHEDIGFGYYWWLSQERGIAMMWGHGGQYAVVYPDKQLVVVVTAGEQTGDDFAFWYNDVLSFSDRIAAICQE